MLLPTIKIEDQGDLGKAVDKILAVFGRIDNPRERRDLIFALSTVSRLANLGLGLATTGAEGEKAQASVADAYVRMMAADAAKALGYEMKDKIK